MSFRVVLVVLLLASLIGIGVGQSAPSAEDLVAFDIPAEDPGPPFYARVTPIMNELFVSNGLLAIPFYRDPACVPADFNLLDFYHFPSDRGAGAFACPVLLEGVAYKEPDAAPTTFPKRVTMDGSGRAQIWFVDAEAARNAIADGSLTLPELAALEPLVGIATVFHEELQPRAEDHLIAIQSSGELTDGRSFRFELRHVGETTEYIEIAMGD